MHGHPMRSSVEFRTFIHVSQGEARFSGCQRQGGGAAMWGTFSMCQTDTLANCRCSGATICGRIAAVGRTRQPTWELAIMVPFRWPGLVLFVAALVCPTAAAQTKATSAQEIAFFETRVRPVL